MIPRFVAGEGGDVQTKFLRETVWVEHQNPSFTEIEMEEIRINLIRETFTEAEEAALIVGFDRKI